jgi:hypothetical protein
MQIAPPATQIDCSLVSDGPAEKRERALAEAVAAAADVIHRDGFAVFHLGRLRLGVAESRGLAVTIATRLREALVRRGLPAEARLEIDKPQRTAVPAGFGTRTLLPHHDGQHCSFLTPSTHDAPNWDPAWREFGSAGYTTTGAHKMYQGIFLSDVGQGLSATTYYDWLGILSDVFERRGLSIGLETGDRRVTAMARWLGGNLHRALERQAEHGCPYPSFGAMLGLDEPAWHGLSFHHSEAELTPAERLRYPLAIPLTQHCPCGQCEGEAARLFCHQVLMATGLNWTQFRARWEITAPGEQCDLLFGHNLSMLHGGFAGGSSRVIEPICLVMDKPAGPAYERWLAASWRHATPR